MRKITRRTISGVLIAVGSLTLLAVYYDISISMLLRLLGGSILLVIAMMIAAVCLLLAAKFLVFAWKWLRGQKDENSDRQ